MTQAVPCPECDSKGMKSSLAESASGELYLCPHCGSQFKQVDEPNQGMVQGCGFGVLTGICSTLLFFLFLVVSPENAPWYYFGVGLLVLIGMDALLSKTVFRRMADSANMNNLEKINEHGKPKCSPGARGKRR